MLNVLYKSLEVFLFINIGIFYPFSYIIIDEVCDNVDCKEILTAYGELIRRTLGFYLFYNILGRKYCKKWNYNPFLFERISILESFFVSLIPIDFNNLFWLLFFYKNIYL